MGLRARRRRPASWFKLQEEQLRCPRDLSCVEPSGVLIVALRRRPAGVLASSAPSRPCVSQSAGRVAPFFVSRLHAACNAPKLYVNFPIAAERAFAARFESVPLLSAFIIRLPSFCCLAPLWRPRAPRRPPRPA